MIDLFHPEVASYHTDVFVLKDDLEGPALL